MAIRHLKKRAPNLDTAAIETVLGLLDGWNGKLSWGLLIEAIAARLRATYTRQALGQHQRITDAFKLAKERLSGRQASERDSPQTLGPIEANALMERLQRVEAENARLLHEKERLVEQFVTWAYNASIRGLDEAFLSQPLPSVHRDQTWAIKGGLSTVLKRGAKP